MPRFIEKCYPFIFGVVAVIFCTWQNITSKDIPQFRELLSASVNMSSIIIGFLATMISILITSVDKSVMQKIRKCNAIDLLTNYINVAVISGLFVAIYSVGYSTVVYRPGGWYWYLFLLWVFVTVLFLTATFRIMQVMLKILTSIAKDPEQELTTSVTDSSHFEFNIEKYGD